MWKYRNGTDQCSIRPAGFDYSSKVTIPINHTQTKTSSRARNTTDSSSRVSITENFIKPIKFTKKSTAKSKSTATVNCHVMSGCFVMFDVQLGEKRRNGMAITRVVKVTSSLSAC